MTGARPFVRNLPVFEGLSCEEASRLDRMVWERRFKARESIFSAGEQAEYVYLVREGWVKLFRVTEDGQESVTAILGPGDIFGEFILGENLCHSVFAEPLEAALLCILPRCNFFRLLTEDPKIALKIIDNIGRRLNRISDALENLRSYDLARRFARLLLLLAAEFGEGPEEAAFIGIRLTHQDLANMIGVCRQTVTGLLGRFRRLGLASGEGHHLTVNRRRLSAFLEQVAPRAGRDEAREALRGTAGQGGSRQPPASKPHPPALRT
ncbi:MAG: Crp/Fnr family transcriptional regulator [Thermaerobacter sp.]|jgi:CRP/FNR family transcriptional regulator|nr:Crp/Fnr family transcriptional regulator [Thermaerobacter sp.]